MLTLLALQLAHAQSTDLVPEVNAQIYRASLDSHATVWAEEPRIPDSGSPFARLTTSYVNGPLRLRYDQGDVEKIVSDALQLDIAGGYAIGPVRLGVDIPVFPLATGQIADLGGGGIGDVAVDAKGVFSAGPVGAGLQTRIALPTASVDLPLAYRGAAWEILALADVTAGKFTGIANLGWRVQPRVELDSFASKDQFLFALAGAFAPTESLGASFEVVGQAGRGTGVPMEWLVGGNYEAREGLAVRAGLGRGFTKGVGSSAFRFVLGVSYEFAVGSKDADRDGIKDDLDACPTVAEDLDGFEDENGCPDLDDDNDGVPDEADGCRQVAEDDDDIQDEDGCPETATRVAMKFLDDQGGFVMNVSVKVDDQAPLNGSAALVAGLEPGIHAIAAESAGMDPVRTAVRVVEDEPATLDLVFYPTGKTGGIVFEVKGPEGEPVRDASWAMEGSAEFHPLVPDASITLPEGFFAVSVSAPGYVGGVFPVVVDPGTETKVLFDLARSRVSFQGDHLALQEEVQFRPGSTSLSGGSDDLLDEVAAVILEHQDLSGVTIRCTVASSATLEEGTALAEGRADAVRKYLVRKGIPVELLQIEGVVAGDGEVGKVEFLTR